MKKLYITFSGSKYDVTTEKIVQYAPRLGANEVWVYDDAWMENQEFRWLNKWLWDHPHKRGYGWYAWKPFVILHALSKLNTGDVVLYTDADTYPISDFSVIYRIAERDGMMLFAAEGWKNRLWCKQDCFICMAQNEPKYYDAQHAVARFLAVRKGSWKPQQFLMEWLTYCVNPLCTTFDESVLAKEPREFKEHRTEQAIMTLLAHKYGYKLHREACQAGARSNRDRDLYPTLFQQDHADLLHVTEQKLGSKFFNVPD